MCATVSVANTGADSCTGTRMALSDMKFFFYRWGPKLTGPSSRLFEKRWGYNFYSEQSMYNWVVRRKAFLAARWLGAPIGIANRATQVAKKLFCKDWDPLPDPDGASRGRQDHVHDRHAVPLAGVTQHRGRGGVAGDDQCFDAVFHQLVHDAQRVGTNPGDRQRPIRTVCGVPDIDDGFIR